MPTEDQKQNLSNAIDRIKQAETMLRASHGKKVQPEYDRLDDLLSKLIEAKELRDDDAFKQATSALSKQSSVLQTDEEQMKAIVGDVKAAADIAGYLAEAAGFLSRL